MILRTRYRNLFSKLHVFSLSKIAITSSPTTNYCVLPTTVISWPCTSELAAHRLSLLASLSRRGLLSAASGVAERIITDSPLREAAAALEYGVSLGVPIEIGRLLRSLITAGQFLKADVVFSFCAKDAVNKDAVILDCMVECYCKLGKLVLAETYLNELVNLGSAPTARAYVALLCARCVDGKHVEAFNLLCSMAVQEGLLPPLPVYNLMIAALCSFGCLDHARFLFDFMFNLGISLPPRPFKCLVYGLSKTNRVLEAEEVCQKMESRGYWLDRALCTALINGYQKEGRIESALKVFERMKGLSICEPDTYAYNTMVHGFLKMGYVDYAKKLLKQMADRGLEWNVVTYGMMINWYCKNRRVDRAMELVDEMSKLGLAANLQCYTAILTALCMEGRLVQVEQLFDEMLGIGIFPDHVMFVLLIKNLKGGYRSLMVQKLLQAIALKCKRDTSGFHALSACCNEVLQRETEDLLDEIMRSDVLPLHEISNVLIGALCAEGKFDAACRLIQKIAGSGYQPSIPTYNLLVSCVCNEGQLNDARSFVSFFMQLSSAYSSLVTYSTKINALCKIGHVDLALQQLDEMIHKGINPTAPIYDSVIGSLSRAGRLNEADLVFNNMLKAGVLPDEVVYTTLIKSYCESGKAVQACRLFEQMIRRGLLPSSRTYGALINGFIKKNMFRNACHFLDMMLKDGFVPNIFLYTKLVNQFSKKGEIRLALDSFNLMLRNQIEPDLIAYGSLICALCRKKRSNKTHLLCRKLKNPRSILLRLEFKGKSISGMLQTKKLSCMSISEKVGFALEKMQDMVNIGLMPDLHIYNGIINGLCRAKRMEDAYKYISQMQGTGLVPNQVTYTILMKSYIRSGEIDNAVSLFNQMSINGCVPDNISYNTLIFGLCVADRAIEGLSLVHGMAKRGLFPNKFTYVTLLECLIRCHPEDTTIKFLEEMVLCNYIPRLSSYKNLFLVLCSMKNLLGVRRAYNLLLKAGRKPDRITKRHLLKTCCRRGEFKMALAIKENMLIDDD